MMEIRSASPDEFSIIYARLKTIPMLWEDVDPARSLFQAAFDQDTIIGFARFEPDEQGALLGSLYVEPAYRKAGTGQAIVEYIEQLTRRRNIPQLFVFSTEAGGFFQRLDFVETPVELTVKTIPHSPQVEWYMRHPHYLAEEVTYVKAL
ncbi:MAG: GNAT family N-acetyltransferase [Chloroflexi bacterium]|nr:GNAT family N-acetyltransferase [Chloroflexota bacterium]